MKTPGLLLLLLGIMSYPGVSYSGYYGTMLISPSVMYQPVGFVTPCLLAPSMAAKYSYSPTGQGNGYVNTYVTSISETSLVGYNQNVAALSSYTMSIGTCSASPVSTALPILMGGASDPVVSGNASGGTTSSSSATIDPLNPALAVSDSLSLWALGITFLSTIWGGRRIYSLFSGDTA
jgi:hypothetical protein